MTDSHTHRDRQTDSNTHTKRQTERQTERPVLTVFVAERAYDSSILVTFASSNSLHLGERAETRKREKSSLNEREI